MTFYQFSVTAVIMARMRKTGLDYYPMDVSFWDDYKIMDLLNEYGPIGVSVYQVIVSQVYRNGYYLEIPIEKLAVSIMRILGTRWIANRERVIEIIRFCGTAELLDKDLMEQSVFTSVGIQRRYAEVAARRKTNRENYWLLKEEAEPDEPLQETEEVPDNDIPAEEKPVSVAEKHVSVAEKPVSVTKIPQKKSKEKKKKQKESKVGVYCLPTKTGEFWVTQELYDDLTHTYSSLNVMKSIEKLGYYLLSHPEKQRCREATEAYLRMWLSDDDERRALSRPKDDGYAGTYNIEEYESESVIDYEDGIWGDEQPVF